MTANSQGNSRPARAQVSPQKLVTRHNAVMFYGIAAAALVESTVAPRAAGLLAVLGADAQLSEWIGQVWLPAKREHAERARAYLGAMWPEFDWPAAWEEYSADCVRLTRTQATGVGVARVALACGSAAAQAAMFYRGLASAADDLELRRLLQGMAADETAHFVRFRRCYEQHRKTERLGMLASYRTIVSCAYRARNLDAQLAFSRLTGNFWYGAAPFAELAYAEFLSRIAAILRRRLPLSLTQRLLFRPWLSPRGLAAAPALRPAASLGGQFAATRLAAGA